MGTGTYKVKEGYCKMAEHQDFDIEINYFVYTHDENGNKLRLVGSYPCKCVARDVVEYLELNHLVKSGMYRKVTEN